MNWNEQQDHTQQIAISHELLQLIQWLIEFNQPEIQQLIQHALKQGLAHHFQHKEQKQSDIGELQVSIMEFFMILENMLHGSLDTQKDEQALQTGIITSLKQVDAHSCSETVLSASANKATSALEQGKNPKEALCKELLKRWKPTKETHIN